MAESVPSVGNLRFYLDYLFRDVELADRRMLDVGAASGGRYSFYAACKGAAEVVALQAHHDGSTAGTAAEFDTTAGRLGLENIRFVASSLSESKLEPAHFDVLLLYASINHLDEEACVRLERDPDARTHYLALLRELARVAAPGATLIVVDCSSRNLFARFGKNPLAPGIEWEKHHPPELWVNLLEEAGFTRAKIRWNSVNTLRAPGRVLLGNRFAAYCLASVFCLTMVRA
jgi:SAM-dependent methyltransferase